LREYRCLFYAQCLGEAARQNLPEIAGCPCGRFEPDEGMDFEQMACLQRLARVVVAGIGPGYPGYPEE